MKNVSKCDGMRVFDDNTLLEALKDVLKAGFSSLTVYENKLSFCKLHKLDANEPLTQILLRNHSYKMRLLKLLILFLQSTIY